jgi:hypothetical protein
MGQSSILLRGWITCSDADSFSLSASQLKISPFNFAYYIAAVLMCAALQFITRSLRGLSKYGAGLKVKLFAIQQMFAMSSCNL